MHLRTNFRDVSLVLKKTNRVSLIMAYVVCVLGASRDASSKSEGMLVFFALGALRNSLCIFIKAQSISEMELLTTPYVLFLTKSKLKIYSDFKI